MVKWEYIAVVLGRDSMGEQAELNNLGQKGWELVSVYESNLGSHQTVRVAHLKRPLVDELRREMLIL